jgi:Double zinc ribbon
MALTSTDIDAIVVVVVLGIIVGALFLYSLRRLRLRRDQLKKELQTPELRQDRAFNRIAMARREADILSRQGVDVATARSLIAQAQGAFDTRNFDRAYESAQSAHEALVAARRGGPLPTGNNVTASNPGPTLAEGPSSAVAPAVPPPTARIPKNRAESQFQLHLLDTELAEAQRTRPTNGGTVAADSLRRQAQESFDREDYTEAFRLSLRARRQLGGKVEALAPSPGGAVTAERNAGEVAAPEDPGATAARLAGASRCPDCGYPMSVNDRFCRGCGTPRGSSVCPVCQAPRTPADTFCGSCGARFS